MKNRNFDPFYEEFDTVILTKNHRLPISEDEGFGIYFSKTMMSLACDERINKLESKLMFFLLASLSDKRYKRGNNGVDLLTGSVYAKKLKNRQQNISRALINLQEYGYISIDKDERKIILINPYLAYTGKFKNYIDTCKRLSKEFNQNDGLKIRNGELDHIIEAPDAEKG